LRHQAGANEGAINSDALVAPELGDKMAQQDEIEFDRLIATTFANPEPYATAEKRDQVRKTGRRVLASLDKSIIESHMYIYIAINTDTEEYLFGKDERRLVDEFWRKFGENSPLYRTVITPESLRAMETNK